MEEVRINACHFPKKGQPVLCDTLQKFRMRTQHSDPKFILYSYHEILNCDISVVGHSAHTFVCSLLPHVDCTIQCENYRKDRMFVPFILACTGYPYTMYSSLNDSQDNCSFEFSGHPTNGNGRSDTNTYSM